MASEPSYSLVGANVSLAVGASSTPVTIPAAANGIKMQAVADDIRYTMDGTTPSATVGFLLDEGKDPVIVYLPHNAQLKFFCAGAADPHLNYQFIKLRNWF